MEKQILLRFKSENGYIEGDADSVEFVAPGSLFFKNDKCYIKYTEALGSESETFKVTVKIEENKVTILRYGEVNTQMVLQAGKKNVSYYETPCGSIVVGVIADTMSLDIGEERGSIKLIYDVEINGALSSRNSIHLTYEETGGSSNE